jgi:hypothetical protein
MIILPRSIQSSRVAIFFLIATNCLPLFGVLFFDWSLLQIFILYWLESAIVGFYFILKIVQTSKWASVVMVPFFIIHYGGFMLGHLIFICAFFARETYTTLLPPAEWWAPIIYAALIPFVGLFISHGISFYTNFYKKERASNLALSWAAPYRRIMVMHFTIVIGGLLVAILQEPTAGLVFLIVAKTIVDVSSHIREHSPKRKARNA